MRLFLITVLCAAGSVWAHDAHGRSNAPAEARRLKIAIAATPQAKESGQRNYALYCANCHGEDGKARTKLAGSLPIRPTDFTNYLMESMKDGEMYWVITNGIEKSMPAFSEKLSEGQRWELVLWVRELRARQRQVEKSQLGPYEWKLPPGFPFPKVPSDNPMTAEKVELGRHLFYDRRLSFNHTQSCASCHQPSVAFADKRGRGVGSTGQMHPRGAMSLMNVAYAPVLTWANPNMRKLEDQALVPMFGDHPIELGMVGKEDLLIQRLRAEPRYGRLFKAAFPGETDLYTISNVTKAIASFERTLLSGESPYDEYRRGDDPNAISASAKRGEALFFSERLECFHCHGGFNLTGSVDYLGKGITEVEFHNTGLYNLPGKVNYPAANTGLFEFTQQEEDIGKFKAPTLRNIALTAPYMHDGSVKTLEDAIEHYRVGGRKITTGPNAGNGFDNPNKSEFVKAFELAASEKQDLLAFLRSLTDATIASNPAWSDPWMPAVSQQVVRLPKPKYMLYGQVVKIYPEDGAVALFHQEIPGFMNAMPGPQAMEFLTLDRQALAKLKPGMRISAAVRKRGSDYMLEQIRITPEQRKSK
jgi:cytochrome c peroxidase